MRIGIISNSDLFIPLAYTLANNNLQVCIFFKPGEEVHVQHKVNTFATVTRMPIVSGDTVEDIYNWISQAKPDVVFVYSYPLLLDVTKFSMPVFNIHPGPLPSFRGPVPVFWQLKKGMPTLCLSIHALSSRFDEGTVVWAKHIPDQPHYNYALVHHIFSQLVIEGVFFILGVLAAKQPLPAIPSQAPAAYHKRPVLEDILIQWQQMTATDICNLIRACNPWNKGATTVLDGQEVKLMDAMQTGMTTTLSPGIIHYQDDHLFIATADQLLLQVNMLQHYDTFVPAYQATHYGIAPGKQLG